ncbi:MAG: saccharopine dehydrogenase C-terminal domain-containing protein [Rhodospirillales bacterium]
MRKLLVLGAGRIGAAIIDLLADTGEYDVVAGDRHEDSLKSLSGKNVTTQTIDVTDETALRSLMDGRDAVISALPFFFDTAVAEAARKARLHYLDLTEDVETAHKIRDIAATADTAFMPQCGLAPGFASIVTYDLTKRFETLETVEIRIGALPQFPTNALLYNLTWSTDGLINAYCNPCDVIHGGERREVLPLEGLEHFSLDGIEYEAFHTSGGIATLCETLDGTVRELNYKTVRYPGHCERMKILIDDLRLGERRDVLKNVLEYAIPMTKQDVVLIFVTVTGKQNGKLTQESYANKVYSREIQGTTWSAIQITTAASVCAVLDLMFEGKLPQKGFVHQEDVALNDFLANRFGRYYAAA